jgi:hypothetical protein
MSFRTFSKAIASNLPGLFVNVGWAINYDGTETISGNHQYPRQHPKAVVVESAAFGALKNGIFKCGIGVGELYAQTLHVVLVARRSNPKSDRTLRSCRGVDGAEQLGCGSYVIRAQNPRGAASTSFRLATKARYAPMGATEWADRARWSIYAVSTAHQFVKVEHVAGGSDRSLGRCRGR